MIRATLVLSAALALVAAAATPSGAANPNDGRWARSIVLRHEDLPSFAAEAPSAGKTCLPAYLDGQSAFARSKQFSSSAQNVTARAWVFPEQKHASNGFRKLVALDYARCLTRDGIIGARILRIKQERFGGVTTGDRFRGIRVTLRLSQAGLRFNVYVDLVFVRRGRAVADAAFTSTGVPFGIAAETAAVGRMSARMQHPPA